MCAVTKVAKLSSWSLPQTINWHEHVHYNLEIEKQHLRVLFNGFHMSDADNTTDHRFLHTTEKKELN